MNNPEKLDLRLNFTNMFRKAKQSKYQIGDPQVTSRSQVLTPHHQKISHHVSRFIPKCPFERSVSVNGQRTSKPSMEQNNEFGIFSLKAFQKKSFGYINQSMQSKHRNGKNKLVIISLKNNSLPLKVDKFEIYQSGSGNQQRKTKIRGLRIRTGSSIMKNRNRVEFDCDSVLVKGQKIVRK